jgi:hypothetical protein
VTVRAPRYFDARRYHLFDDLDVFPLGGADRAVYELGVGLVQCIPWIPFEMLWLISGGRRAYVIGGLVRSGVESVPVMPLLPDFLEGHRSVLADIW